jgi:hypothetical protein
MPARRRRSKILATSRAVANNEDNFPGWIVEAIFVRMIDPARSSWRDRNGFVPQNGITLLWRLRADPGESAASRATRDRARGEGHRQSPSAIPIASTMRGSCSFHATSTPEADAWTQP